MFVLLGDSLSVGASSALKTRHPEVDVVAKVGAPLSWMDGQVDAIVAKAPSLVLLMGGTNDLAGTDAATAVQRLVNLVSRLRSRGLRVIASTVPPVRTANAQKTRDYNQAILGGALGTTEVVDVGGLVTEADLSADGVHPKSYTKMGNGWADVVDQDKAAPSSAGTSSEESSFGVVGGVLVALGAVAFLSAVYRRKP